MLILSALHTQLKISIEPDLAESFKAACMNAGVSMAAELSALIAARIGVTAKPSVKPARPAGYDSRPKRRYHVSQIITQLEDIREHEDAYLDRIPENLQSGSAYENAELSIDILDQVIDLLNEAY